MPEQGEFLTDEEMDEVDKAIAIGTAICLGFGGGPTCAVVGGYFTLSIHAFDWFWEHVFPDDWKAQGAFDYGLIIDEIFSKMKQIYETNLKMVDETWDKMREEKGLPLAPSPASNFLNDWVTRNGWKEGGIEKWPLPEIPNLLGIHRWIKLVPEDGPWAITFGGYSVWPKRASEDTVKLFTNLLCNLYENHRLVILKEGVRATMEFIALSLLGHSFKSNAGLIREASWVHGNIFKAEDRAIPIDVESKGWGKAFSYQGETAAANWFHASIPAPVVLDDIRPVLTKFFIQYTCSKAKITDIHLYDGKNRILVMENLSLEGDHKNSFDSSNSWLTFPYPTIYSGLGISVKVHFTGGAGRSKITFNAAGADFNRSK